MFETVRYTYRLRPGVVAERALLDEWHRCRFLWNAAVHQPDHQLIAVEDFKPKFLTRSTMARKAADAAIGAAKRELIERDVRAGRKVVLVPPAYTTMTCSACHTIAKQRLELGERTFQCEHCGYTADRDRNAARVILATAEPDRAGVDDVRHHSPPSEDAGGAVRVRNPPASAVGKD